MHFLGFTVLPWQGTVLPQEMGCPVRAQLHPRHGTTTSIAATIFYYRRKSGTTALCAVLLPRRYYRDDTRYYRTVESPWGLRAGRGSSISPYSFTLSPHAVSLAPAQERHRRTPPDLCLWPLSSDSDRWDPSPPLPLAMEQGFSSNPSLFASFLCF